MSKRSLVLVAVGGAFVVAGYVYRKPLRSTLSRYGDYAHGFVADMVEQQAQRRQNEALKRHDHVDHVHHVQTPVWQDNVPDAQ